MPPAGGAYARTPCTYKEGGRKRHRLVPSDLALRGSRAGSLRSGSRPCWRCVCGMRRRGGGGVRERVVLLKKRDLEWGRGRGGGGGWGRAGAGRRA